MSLGARWRTPATVARVGPFLRRWLGRLALVLLVLPPVVLLVFRFVDPPLTPLMAIRWLQGYGLDHRPVPLGAVAPALRRAVIAGEDNLFCRHWGFDWRALGEEIETALDGGRPRGASTITMQTAKNVLLWPGRDPVRKLLEAWLTPQVELLWSKRRILEVYLGVAELGPGIYGAEAAAQHWFKKPASWLTEREAARLAAILPAPTRWSPVRPSPAVARRAALIERRMGQLGPLLACAG